jgi:hypothetical protein
MGSFRFKKRKKWALSLQYDIMEPIQKKRNFYHPQVSSNQMYTFQGQNCHAKIHFSNYVCVILFVAPDKKLQTIYDIYTLINALFFFDKFD